MSCPALVLVCEKCRVECSAAFMSNNRDGCTSKRNDLPCAKLREHRDCQLQSSPSVCFWHRHLHSMTQSVFCFFYFFLRTTRASQLLRRFSRVAEAVFGYESDYWASCYKFKEENNVCFLGRPPFLSDLFVITFEHVFICIMYMLPSQKIWK